MLQASKILSIQTHQVLPALPDLLLQPLYLMLVSFMLGEQLAVLKYVILEGLHDRPDETPQSLHSLKLLVEQHRSLDIEELDILPK